MLGGNYDIKYAVLGYINTLMSECNQSGVEACNLLVDYIDGQVKQNDIVFTLEKNTRNIYANYLIYL